MAFVGSVGDIIAAFTEGAAGTFVTADSFQGVLGEFKEVPDHAGSVTYSANSFQGVLGEFKYVRDLTQ